MSDRIEIIKELRALESFCAFPRQMSGEERERFMKDYLADIQEFPLAAIRSACAEWRRSGNAKFPISGQLIPVIRRFVGADERRSKAQPWSPAAREEFRDMSVRDKIRELTILAHEARTKAGPMFRNTTPKGSAKVSGVHLSADQMPDTYRRWTAEAERLEAEIGRLRKIVATPYAQAAE